MSCVVVVVVEVEDEEEEEDFGPLSALSRPFTPIGGGFLRFLNNFQIFRATKSLSQKIEVNLF
jgi:hypothetical protein